jgi:two-component system sensor histidine kinase KdpD
MRVERLQRRDAAVLLGGLVAVGAAVSGFRAIPAIVPTTVGLVLLLIVLVTATFGRLWVASVVAIMATGAFNFYFFPPVGTFTIADPQNWAAVIVFLITAVIASNLSAAAQARAREAVARRDEVTRLFDLTRDVLLTTEAAGAIDQLVRHVARRFELFRVAICLPGDHGWRVHQGGAENVHVDTEVLDQALAKARGSLEFDAQSRTYVGHVRVDGKDGGLLLVPLRHGTRAVGVLAAMAPTVDAGAIDAVAGVVAIAIERTQFLLERETAELVRQKADVAATLLASLSHDLKTPVTAIRVAVENLRSELPREEREAQSSVASVELQRLTRLLQDILDMARIDAAAIHLEPQWVTPADIVDAAAAHVRHTLAGRNLRINADSDSEVHLDPRVVSVALSHLIENAGQYSPPDREITVDACVDEEGLRVAVTDQGPGLDSSETEHLFERFFRGRTARQLSSGTGMGLAITRGLLTAVNGRVSAENVPGSGARFTIIVPGPRRPVRTPV